MTCAARPFVEYCRGFCYNSPVYINRGCPVRRFFLFAFLTAAVLSVSACGVPDRKSLDEKEANACVGAIRALSNSTDEIIVLGKTFKTEKSFDGFDLRTVSLQTHFIRDKGMIMEKSYTCSYEETFGIFGADIRFYRLEMDGVMYGNIDGEIKGGFEELLRIQSATDDAMK